MNPEEIQARIREIFRHEAVELVAELEAALLELEQAPAHSGIIGRVFRALHTLKGSGATSGYPELSQFVHRVEDVFFAAREGQIAVSSPIIDHSLEIADTIARYLAAPAQEAAAVLASGQGALAALLSSVPACSRGESAAEPAAAVAPRQRRFHIRYVPKAHLFETGTDPGLQLDDLRALGSCTVRCIADRLPPIAALAPTECHLGWEIDLETAAGDAAIREVFLFVDGDCELSIVEQPLAASARAPAPSAWTIGFTIDERTAATPAALDTLFLELGKLGRHRVLFSPPEIHGRRSPGPWRVVLETDPGVSEDAIRDAFIFMSGVAPTLERRGALGSGSEPGVALRLETTAPGAAAAGAESPTPPPAANARSGAGESLRVSADRLDRLVNMVGELVILRSQVTNACAGMPDVPSQLQSASEGLERLTKELRDVVLEVRMMPIGETFTKFKRLCRDLARDLGKVVELEIAGADTELDKTVLEQLKDPLVHLVRNCLDHGLETPEERVAAGKPPQGTLRLAAEQRGDRVWVTVSDDGRGLDAERIRAKAVARGLIAADAVPAEAEIFQFVFLAGFSTAERVSQVSGRGVGLDVVKRHLEALRGTVEISSRKGQGTEVRLSVPLTLAIIEGLLVGVGGDRYVLPLGIAQETIEIDRRQRERANGRNVVELRGQLVPFLRLREVFDYESTPPDLERAVIVECDDKRLGLVVDEVIGSHQTVLKSLGWLSRHVKAFSGATVMGDGHIGLICDVPALVAYAAEKRGRGLGLEV
jgi:two-component system chemotaxis sensor kinase CheA